MLRQTEKATVKPSTLDNSKRAKENVNMAGNTPNKDILDTICDRFQIKLAQWVNLHGAEAHYSIKDKYFKLSRITEGHEIKIGVSCPFCQIPIMLFFKMTNETSFKVVISNYAKHYNLNHTSAKEFGKKQTN